MYKILITGADGFVGRHLFDKLSSMDYDVWGVDNNITSNPTNKNQIFFADLATMTNSWLHEPMSNWWGEHHTSFDIIIHLAALARIPRSLENPAKYIENNVLSTLNVLEYCRKYNTKLVVASSSTVAIDRDHNPYTESKRMVENMCQCYSKCYNVDIAVLRYFNVYGDGMSKGSYSTAVQKFLESDKIVIHGDGSQTRMFTHVDDVVDATIMAMLDVNGLNMYDVVNDNDLFTIKELAELYNKPIEYDWTAHTGELAQYSKLKKVPDWKPKHNLKEWLQGKLQ